MRHLLALWIVAATTGCCAPSPAALPARAETRTVIDSVRVDVDSARAEGIRSTHYRISVPVAQYARDSPDHIRANATLLRMTRAFSRTEFPGYSADGQNAAGRVQIFRSATVRGSLTSEWSTPDVYSGLLSLWMFSDGWGGRDGRTLEWSRLRPITLDVTTDTLVALGDLFEPGSPWLDRLADAALPQLRRQATSFGQQAAKHTTDVGPYNSSRDERLNALSAESLAAAAFTLGPDALILHVERTAVTDWGYNNNDGPPPVFRVSVAYTDLEPVLRRDGLVARIRSGR